MRDTKRHFLHLSCSMLLCLSLAACEKPNITPEQASPYVDQWAQEVGPQLKGQATQTATTKSLQTLLTANAEKSSSALLRGHPPYDKLAEQVYHARKYEPGFVKDDGQLNDAGIAVLKQIEQVHRDGFDHKYYHTAKIQEDLTTLAELRKEYKALGDFKPGPKEKSLIRTYLTSQKAENFKLTPDNYSKLTAHLLASDASSDIKAQIQKFGDLSKKMAQLEARVEQRLAVGLMRYAYKLRYAHVPDIFVHPRQDDRFNDPETRRRRKASEKSVYTGQLLWRHATFVAQNMNKKRGGEISRKRLQETLLMAMDTKQTKQVLAKLVPSPQYAKLRNEFVRYSAIVDSGGWKKVGKAKVRSGQKKDVVKQLKVRLKKEGYFPKKGVIDTRFDADLKDAIKAYQASHQMKEDGKVGRSFWRSVNISAKRRRDQILLNMQRWRKSDVQHHDQDVYVLVNIPGFHTEIWKKQQRELRMRIVVGNNDTAEDEKTKKNIHPNRTPVLSAFIDRVIYNPFWNVTSRIRETEILVDVRKDLEGRYISKLNKLLGTPTPAPTGATTGLVGGTDVAVSFTKRSKEGVIFNTDKIKYAYQQKHGSEPDLKALFPYLSEETGLIDVSKTNPKNIPPWYAVNGYEVMRPGQSWEHVRQLNGKKNALGQVKVIFPNLHDVYLHDTNSKSLFKNNIRAYSHGCMRMHKPLKFAQWILENDNNWNGPRVKKLLAKVEYEPIFLKSKVPVHVEYFTVRVDDKDRANFLIDIYDKDRAPKKER